MTNDECKQIIRRVFGDPESGLYPQAPCNPDIVQIWYATLRPYALDRVQQAVTRAYTADPKNLPALDAVVDRLKGQAPPALPDPPWWTPEIAAAVQTTGINGAFAVLRARQQDSDWRACHLALKDEELTRPGREAAYLARCRQYAAQYPADRASWLDEIARVEARLQAEGLPPPRPTPPAQVGSFTHVSAPRKQTPRRRRHADAHD